MKVLCTFPGKYGDLLWALPTVRAISRRAGAPVDLAIPSAFKSIIPLLRHQPYLRQVVELYTWEVQDTAPISPRVPPYLVTGCSDGTQLYDQTIHLGYRDWPLPNVMWHTVDTAAAYYPDIQLSELAIHEPWIRVREPTKLSYSWSWNFGFTDEYFELKYGVVQLLLRKWPQLESPSTMRPMMLGAGNPRWEGEAGQAPCTWEESTVYLQHTQVFLTDCSALHVLAVACGTPVVLLEPQSMRHNTVFYPLGMQGPQVVMVMGSDGHPTFDARHVGDALELALAMRSITDGTSREEAG